MNLHRLDNPAPLKPVVPLEAPDVEALVMTLSIAFHDEPNFVYLAPDERTRPIVLASFFRSAIRVGELCGEIHTTENADTVAIWVRPEHNRPLHPLMQTAPMLLPPDQGSEFTTRYMNLYASVEEARRRLAPGPHWYLMLLGGEAAESDHLMHEFLIKPILRRAGATGLPCYLETFAENRLAFYKECGFRIAGAGRGLEGGPNFWAMTRAAAQSASMT
jgi:hypothetical protein